MKHNRDRRDRRAVPAGDVHQPPRHRARHKPAHGSRDADRRPRVGQQLTVDVTHLTVGGDAVARWGQYVLFVTPAIPGERVLVEVVSTGRRYGRARVLRVDRPAPSRVKPNCRHFGECGGCQWQHIDYAEQLVHKEQLLRATIEHKLRTSRVPVQPVIGMTEPWGNRNKAHFLVAPQRGKPALGHYRAHSRDVITVTECPVHDGQANKIAGTLVRLLDKHGVKPFSEVSRTGVARHIVVRTSTKGAAQATLVATHARAKHLEKIAEELVAAHPELTGVHVSPNSQPGTVVFGPHSQRLAGERQLVERIEGVEFLISPTAFFQTNAEGAARLVSIVLGAVPEQSRDILDLYAGVGLFALPLARRGHRVTAIEENANAVHDAIESAKRNRIAGCRFQTGKVESVLKSLVHRTKFDLVILDPPREGCPEWLLRLIAERLQPARIVDVSCDPHSLANDLATITHAGYEVRSIQPIDMFPHTSHIESVAVLDRRERVRWDENMASRRTTGARTGKGRPPGFRN